MLPPPRHTHVQCLVLLTAEAREAAFPAAPLRATDACRSAAAASTSAGFGESICLLASSLTSGWAGRARTRAHAGGFFDARQVGARAAEAADPSCWGAPPASAAQPGPSPSACHTVTGISLTPGEGSKHDKHDGVWNLQAPMTCAAPPAGKTGLEVLAASEPRGSASAPASVRDGAMSARSSTASAPSSVSSAARRAEPCLHWRAKPRHPQGSEGHAVARVVSCVTGHLQLPSLESEGISSIT